MMTPAEVEQVARQDSGYGPLRLSRDGNFAVVQVQRSDGAWVPVIRELASHNFDHMITAVGVWESMVLAGSKPCECPRCDGTGLVRRVKLEDHLCRCAAGVSLGAPGPGSGDSAGD